MHIDKHTCLFPSFTYFWWFYGGGGPLYEEEYCAPCIHLKASFSIQKASTFNQLLHYQWMKIAVSVNVHFLFTL